MNDYKLEMFFDIIFALKYSTQFLNKEPKQIKISFKLNSFSRISRNTFLQG